MDLPDISLTKNLLDWYWQYGVTRQGGYALSLGKWGYELTSAHKRLAAIMAECSRARRCAAIWGPSAAGKSISVASGIDGSGDAVGCALNWGADRPPVSFVSARNNARRDSVIQNPLNGGADASGCISRFVLRQEVVDGLHPVRIQLGSEMDILHALAMGYETCPNYLAADAGRRHLSPESFRAKLKALTATKTELTPKHRELFEWFHGFCDLIETLTEGDNNRYIGLRGTWSSLRSELLERFTAFSNRLYA
jgi:hypothetical protein